MSEGAPGTVNSCDGEKAPSAPVLIRLLFLLYRGGIRPFFGSTCRFEPSCSSFVEEAIARFGIVGGTLMGLRRLSRCHPFHPGGYDPVPTDDSASRRKLAGDGSSSENVPNPTFSSVHASIHASIPASTHASIYASIQASASGQDRGA